MIERCKAAKFDAIALTVDTIVSGNRERCLRSGFTSPPRFTAASVLSYATHPGWVANYLFREKFALPNLQSHVDAGTDVAVQSRVFQYDARHIDGLENGRESSCRLGRRVLPEGYHVGR